MEADMARSRLALLAMMTALLGLVIPMGGASASEGSGWTSAGGNRENTRFQQSENKLSVDTVGDLSVQWAFTTGGDVSATPAVDGDTVYVPDWAGNLYAVDRLSGAPRWVVGIPAVTGIDGDKARATPAVTEDKVVVGTQGPFGGGGKVLAFDKFTGELVWSTVADDHPAAIITQSATVFDGVVYVGVASLEEALAAFIPGYPCCSFRGSMLAIDAATGAILWKTYFAPEGYSGNAVWGSSPAIDAKRKQVYVATGNNYSVPQSVLDCVAAAGDDAAAKAACLPGDNHFDSILALDLRTGAINWATRALPFDAWTVDCIPFFGDGDNCPDPAGPDYDFGQAPALFTAKDDGGKPHEFVGAGQKSGQYWTLDPDTGAIVWFTQAGPGGVAGGLQWGSAVDGRRVYTANANSDLTPWVLPDGSTTNQGVWSALDALTGEILWQVTPTYGGGTSGPVTTANGVVYGCSLDPLGHMYALDAATGDELWSFASGGSCLSGAAISRGMLYWGSGYTNLGPPGTPNNKLYAFGLSD
jgi:polyvinyl alcohol dehydrogenase (cytochrome)